MGPHELRIVSGRGVCAIAGDLLPQQGAPVIDPLRVIPMTPAEVAELVERARANERAIWDASPGRPYSTAPANKRGPRGQFLPRSKS